MCIDLILYYWYASHKFVHPNTILQFHILNYTYLPVYVLPIPWHQRSKVGILSLITENISYQIVQFYFQTIRIDCPHRLRVDTLHAKRPPLHSPTHPLSWIPPCIIYEPPTLCSPFSHKSITTVWSRVVYLDMYSFHFKI